MRPLSVEIDCEKLKQEQRDVGFTEEEEF